MTIVEKCSEVVRTILRKEEGVGMLPFWKFNQKFKNEYVKRYQNNINFAFDEIISILRKEGYEVKTIKRGRYIMGCTIDRRVYEKHTANKPSSNQERIRRNKRKSEGEKIYEKFAKIKLRRNDNNTPIMNVGDDFSKCLIQCEGRDLESCIDESVKSIRKLREKRSGVWVG